MPVVGFISGGSAGVFTREVAAFRKGLSETGYIEGQTATVEYHWLEDVYKRQRYPHPLAAQELC